MDYYLERLERELVKIFNFWNLKILSTESVGLIPECSNDGVANLNAPTGSLYLSRVIYGASAACRFLNTNEYKKFADAAFKSLYERLKNPEGGFYWAKSLDGSILHDTDHANMAQAFVLYGFAEYAMLTKNPIIESELKKQQAFIVKQTGDKENGGFLDGFAADWTQEKAYKKSLGTHIHNLEAFAKHYEYSKDTKLLSSISDLITLITGKFIDSSNLSCYQSLSPQWEILPGINLAGHNAEVSWILTSAAKLTGDSSLQSHCNGLAYKITERVFEFAFDKSYGGVFNILRDNAPIEDTKFWWPQTEAAIAALNAYEYSKDKTFLSYAIRLIEYIENTFSDDSVGEWFAEVSREGNPRNEQAKVSLWKSLYHNVRYCIEVSRRLKVIINDQQKMHSFSL